MAAAVTGIVGLPKEHIESIVTEMEMMIHKLRLLTDPSFWEGHAHGIQQIEDGECLTLEELVEKYEM